MPAKFPGSRKRVDSIQLDVENYRRWMFIQHIAYFYFSLFTIPIPIFFPSFLRSIWSPTSKNRVLNTIVRLMNEFARVINITESKFFLGICTMNICRWEGRKSLWIDNSLYKWIFYLSNIQRRIRKQLLFSSSCIDLLKSWRKIKNRTNNPRTVLHPSHSTFEPSQACIYTIFPKRTIESQDRNCFEISIIQTSRIFSFFLFPSFYLNKAKSKTFLSLDHPRESRAHKESWESVHASIISA